MTGRLDYKHPAEELLIWEPVMGWEMPWARGRCVPPAGVTCRQGHWAHLSLLPPSCCHGNDQLPITCMHALPCLRAHGRKYALLAGKKIYIPSLAQKGSTPLPGSPCDRQAINWVIFPCFVEGGGEGRTKSAPSVANLLQDELSTTSPQGLPCSHEHQKARVHQAP